MRVLSLRFSDLAVFSLGELAELLVDINEGEEDDASAPDAIFTL